MMGLSEVVAAFNQENALVGGAFSVIWKPVVEPMDRFAALEETFVSREENKH